MIPDENERNSTILIVDDLMPNVMLLTNFLSPYGYRILKAYNGEEALEVIAKEHPDLILLDIMMPGVSGIDVCRKVKNDPKTMLIPIIIVTALDEMEEHINSIEAGADDFITKPFNSLLLRTRIKALLKSKMLIDKLDSSEEVIYSLANVIEARDEYTEGHTRRVADYSVAMGKVLNLSEMDLEALEKGGHMHDIGKVGISDAILKKPASLSDEEFDMMKQHPIIGENICKPLKSINSLLGIIRGHHERLDGSGYPDGLKGDQISTLTRIVSIADVYDALVTDRPYRKALSQEKAFEILNDEGKRGLFDTEIVKIFIDLIENNKIEDKLAKND